MTCPSCRGSVPASQERCPSCGATVAPVVEGALAPDPARSRPEPLREIPGLKKRERTWKDEVRERVRDRRVQRGGGDLPLFREDDDALLAEPEIADTGQTSAEAEEPSDIAAERRFELGDDSAPPIEAEDDDLPLRMESEVQSPRPRERVVTPVSVPAPRAARVVDLISESEASPTSDWGLGEDTTEAGRPVERPVERPAFAGERLRAFALDAGLLSSLWALVVYFASRAAHVGLAGLLPTWPYFAAYFALVGILYAAYFTGANGQTLGKMATGLRVVDPEGRPPGFGRSAVRAVLGSLGVLAAGAGVFPILFDPARRAFHDRLLRTRVVKG